MSSRHFTSGFEGKVVRQVMIGQHETFKSVDLKPAEAPDGDIGQHKEGFPHTGRQG
jgi:hypothetical protein